MTDLSPAAQAVLDAFTDEWPWQTMPQTHESLAAALRAAINQVVPEYRENRPKTFDEKHRKMDVSPIRYCLLDIADELEAMSS
jgi:hypothetical protein